MPQNPAYTSINPSGVAVPVRADAQGGTLIAEATRSALNITAATVVKATPGRLVRVSVVVAGSAVGTINDVATTGAVAVANQVGALLNTVGTTVFQWPCLVGIVVVPGTGQTVSVSFA